MDNQKMPENAELNRERELKAILLAELFFKLSETEQNYIISSIKALLSQG